MMDNEIRERLQIGTTGISHDYVNRVLCGVVLIDCLDEPNGWPLGEEHLRQQLAIAGQRIPTYVEYVRHNLGPTYEGQRTVYPHQPRLSDHDILALAEPERVARLDAMVDLLRSATNQWWEQMNLAHVKLAMGLSAIVIYGEGRIEDIGRRFRLIPDYDANVLLKLVGASSCDEQRVGTEAFVRALVGDAPRMQA